MSYWFIIDFMLVSGLPEPTDVGMSYPDEPKGPMSHRLHGTPNERLKQMIEEATVDCYNESEQVTGLFTMIDENLGLPFETLVLGVSRCCRTVGPER